MTSNLATRVRRLEDAAAVTMGRAEQMRLQRAARLALSSKEQAEHRAQHLAACIASLTAPDEPIGTPARAAQCMRRSRARRLTGASQ